MNLEEALNILLKLANHHSHCVSKCGSWLVITLKYSPTKEREPALTFSNLPAILQAKEHLFMGGVENHKSNIQLRLKSDTKMNMFING